MNISFNKAIKRNYGYRMFKILMKKHILFFTILLCGCVHSSNKVVTHNVEDVQFAVLKYEFERYSESISKKELRYFFIEIEEREPSVEFLKKFNGHPEVIGISFSKIDCGDSSGRNNEVRHKVNGETGVIVRLHKLKKISDIKYEVSFSSVRNCLGGGGFNGVVELQNGVWVVKQIEDTWVS